MGGFGKQCFVVFAGVMATAAFAGNNGGNRIRQNVTNHPPKEERKKIAKERIPFCVYTEKARLNGQASAPDEPLSIWFRKPASKYYWECLPIGNGWLGGMVYGGVHTERIQFNEHTLWTGSDAYDDIGCYKPFGDILVELGHNEAGNYRRDLNLATGINSVEYTSGGTRYKREAFCSYPDKVMVVRFTADKSSSLTGAVSITNLYDQLAGADGNRLTWANAFSNGLEYEAQVLVLNEGGEVSAGKDSIQFTDADAVTILLATGTSYVPDSTKGWLGEHPHQKVTETIRAAASKSYSALKDTHLSDFTELFDRVRLDLGETDASRKEQPFSTRTRQYKQGPDPDLEELIFQFGRYLMIGSSRANTLPANLQGIWNESIYPPWNCDYHLDLNLQMNYWPAETAALSDCVPPLLDYLQSLIPPARKTLQEQEPGKRGWYVNTAINIFGGGSHSMGACPTWMVQHFWEHYAFGQDEEYLRKTAYPVIKELCEYWEDTLVSWDDGTLVSPSARSPEHGCNLKKDKDGRPNVAFFDQQLVWDLFTNYIEASRVLDIDADYRARIAAMREKLIKPRIGSWGQLQEWSADVDKPDDRHRHLSHFIAVYSGKQISPLTAPELAEAAKVSLNARGDSSTSWGMCHRAACWARLHDGDHAYKVLAEMLKMGRIHENLLSSISGGGYQIDANFGFTAAIGEMLLQSHLQDEKTHAYRIHLLPALPEAWESGSVKGLRARGGFAVDISWEDGKLTEAVIHSRSGKKCHVRYGSKEIALEVEPGKSVKLNHLLK